MGVFSCTKSLEICTISNYDAGVECTDLSQCESYCQAKSGTRVQKLNCAINDSNQ